MHCSARWLLPKLILSASILSGCHSVKRQEPAPQPIAAASVPEPSYLAFSELIAKGTKLAISERAHAHVGQRVKLVGYMANLELPPDGAFYLAPIAVTCDEAGDGTAELPLNSVLVTSSNAVAKPVPHIDGLIEVVGKFEVGRTTDSLGRATWFRLTLDDSVASNQPTPAKFALRASP